MAGVRAAVEELHAKFPPPAEVEVTAANAGGVPALRCGPPDPVGVALLSADLSGLPPLLVEAGTGDNLVNEARLLAERGTPRAST